MHKIGLTYLGLCIMATAGFMEACALAFEGAQTGEWMRALPFYWMRVPRQPK